MSLLPEYFSWSQFSFIQLFGLVFPIALIVNLFLLLIWISVKSKLALFQVIVILLSASEIPSVFQISLNEDNSCGNQQIKLLSYNVKNFKYNNNDKSNEVTKKDIVHFLVAQDADIVCLQEYHSMTFQQYQPVKDIRDALHANTYYYESFFTHKNNQLSGLVTFSKYEAIGKGKFKFDGSRTFGTYTDVLINGDTVRIFNIHFASIKLQKDDIDFMVSVKPESNTEIKTHSWKIYNKLSKAFELREKQVSFILNEIENSKYKVIICGDFNDTPASWVYNQVTSKLNDTFVEKGNGFGSTYAGPLPLLRIDYIFVDNSFTTCEFKKYDIEKSDHFPISAIVESK